MSHFHKQSGQFNPVPSLHFYLQRDHLSSSSVAHVHISEVRNVYSPALNQEKKQVKLVTLFTDASHNDLYKGHA